MGDFREIIVKRETKDKAWDILKKIRLDVDESADNVSEAKNVRREIMNQITAQYSNFSKDLGKKIFDLENDDNKNEIQKNIEIQKCWSDFERTTIRDIEADILYNLLNLIK